MQEQEVRSSGGRLGVRKRKGHALPSTRPSARPHLCPQAKEGSEAAKVVFWEAKHCRSHSEPFGDKSCLQ